MVSCAICLHRSQLLRRKCLFSITIHPSLKCICYSLTSITTQEDTLVVWRMITHKLSKALIFCVNSLPITFEPDAARGRRFLSRPSHDRPNRDRPSLRGLVAFCNQRINKTRGLQWNPYINLSDRPSKKEPRHKRQQIPCFVLTLLISLMELQKIDGSICLMEGASFFEVICSPLVEGLLPCVSQLLSFFGIGNV